MKHKQLFGLFAAASLLTCGMNAVAAETAKGPDSITIKSTNGIPLNKENFLAYRLLDAEYISDTEEKYTIISEWQQFFNDQLHKTSSNPCTGAEAQEYLLKLQKNPKDFKAFKKAAYDYAQKHKIQDIGTDTKGKDSEGNEFYKISDLPNGYYIIIQQDTKETVAVSKDMLVTVDSHNRQVNIDLKADVPALLKTINADGEHDKKAESYNIGDKVPFRLVSKVPDMSGYMSATNSSNKGCYIFEVYEKMSKGLTLDPQSIKIKIGNQDYKNFKVVEADDPSTEEKEWRIVFGTTTTFEGKTEQGSFDANLSDEDGVLSDAMFKANIDKPITITYNATLNENAILGSKGNPNTANVKYSSNPYHQTETKHTWDSTASAYSFGLDITKVNSKETPLKGAEFNLKSNDVTVHVKPVENGERKGHYVVCKSSDDKSTTTLISDDQGKIYIDGLDQGNYQLVETKAPAGYKLLAEPIEFSIEPTFTINEKTIEASLKELNTNNDKLTADKESGYLSTKIVNVTGGLLPKTGGRGAIMFIVAGVAVITGATVVTLKSRKKSA